MGNDEKVAKKQVGQRFRQFRLAIGFTQSEMAKLLGLTQTTITGIETGKSYPSFPSLIYLARHQSLSLSWLATGKGAMSEKILDPIGQLIDRTGYKEEIEDLLRYMAEIPFVREYILEDFALFKLRKKPEIQNYLNDRSELTEDVPNGSGSTKGRNKNR